MRRIIALALRLFRRPIILRHDAGGEGSLYLKGSGIVESITLRMRRRKFCEVDRKPRKTYPHVFAKALAMHIDAATPGGMED